MLACITASVCFGYVRSSGQFHSKVPFGNTRSLPSRTSLSIFLCSVALPPLSTYGLKYGIAVNLSQNVERITERSQNPVLFRYLFAERHNFAQHLIEFRQRTYDQIVY